MLPPPDVTPPSSYPSAYTCVRGWPTLIYNAEFGTRQIPNPVFLQPQELNTTMQYTHNNIGSIDKKKNRNKIAKMAQTLSRHNGIKIFVKNIS